MSELTAAGLRARGIDHERAQDDNDLLDSVRVLLSRGVTLDELEEFGFAKALSQRSIRPNPLHGIDADEALDHVGIDEEFSRRLRLAMGLQGGSGSDLASLTTKAILDGDEWIVSGQKVWTSGAQQSQYAILLARTDWDAPKHRGITMFILPMEQPGVDVRGLVQMTGVSEFNEVFIDEARIPKDWVIGEVNGGWATAVALLGHERQQTGAKSMSGTSESRSKAGRSPIPVAQLIELAERAERSGDPIVRQQLARLHSGEQVVRWIGARGLHPSIGKLWRTKQGRAAAELAVALAFPGGAAWGSDMDVERNFDDDYFHYHFLNCRGMSLGGGTDEIQRNTLGERALGLPREPGVDKNTPFNELPKN